MDGDKKTFSNDNMELTVTQQPGCQVTFDVQINPTATTAAYKKAVKNVNKEVSLPGFRKGRAPEAMVVEHFQKYVTEEWANLIAQTSIKECIALSEIQPLDQRSISKPKLDKCSKEEGAVLQFNFESEPTTPELDLSGLQLEQPPIPEVDPAEVENELVAFKNRNADWEPVSDRPVEEGDFVDLDIDAIEDPAHNICSNMRFEVSDDRISPWLKALVIGMNVDEEKEGMSEKDPDSEEEAFEPKKCRVVVKGIFKQVAPELTDELAQKEGYDTVDELRNAIHGSIEQTYKRSQQASLRQQFQDFLIDKHSFDLPTSVVTHETENQFRLQKMIAKRSGMKEEELPGHEEQFRTQAKEDAQKHLLIAFLMQKIAMQHELTISREELMQEMMKAYYGQGDMVAVDESTNPDAVRSQLVVKLMTIKAMDRCIQEALNSV